MIRAKCPVCLGVFPAGSEHQCRIVRCPRCGAEAPIAGVHRCVAKARYAAPKVETVVEAPKRDRKEYMREYMKQRRQQEKPA